MASRVVALPNSHSHVEFDLLRILMKLYLVTLSVTPIPKMVFLGPYFSRGSYFNIYLLVCKYRVHPQNPAEKM